MEATPPTPGAVQIRLEVEASGDPIRGRLLDGGGEEDSEFYGWMQLMAAIEAARADAARPA